MSVATARHIIIFSLISSLLPNISSTRTTKIVNKELAYSFGITGITPISIWHTIAENTILFLSPRRISRFTGLRSWTQTRSNDKPDKWKEDK